MTLLGAPVAGEPTLGPQPVASKWTGAARRLLDAVLWPRARDLVGWLRPRLPGVHTVLDIGSGTGHTGVLLRDGHGLEVLEADVVDMHWVGPGPLVFDGQELPLDHGCADAALLVFVLQYAEDPEALLREAARTSGRVVVVQSTFEGRVARLVLAARELVWGPLALAVAWALRALPRFDSPLVTRRHFTRPELLRLVEDAGLRVCHHESRRAWGLEVCRDLLVLEAAPP